MRNLAIFGAVIFAVSLSDMQNTTSAAWCGRDIYGSLNCSFPTQEQCRASMSGIGGSCWDNGGSTAQPAGEKKKKQVNPR
jgi:hypothetical protein